MQRASRVLFAVVAAIVALNAATRIGEARWYAGGYGNYGGYGRYGAGGYGRYGAGYGGYGMGYGGFYGGGTVAGSALQGMSSVIQAKGQYNESTSRAAINYQEASSKYADNTKKWQDTYYSIREKNDKITADRLARDKIPPEVLAQAARSGLPKPLSSEALDPITGKIKWPEVLEGDAYSRPRQEIDHLLELHATTGGAGTSQPLQAAVAQMVEILKSNIRDLPTNGYIAARKFLDSLAFTVGQT